jgi:hypothetical protein
MKLAEKLRKGVHKAPKEKVPVPFTEAQIRLGKFHSLKEFVLKNAGQKTYETLPPHRFLDVPIFKNDLILVNEMSDYNWDYEIDPKGHLLMFIKWAMKQGFIVERVRRHDKMDKDPGEFNKEYTLRLKW